MPKGTGLGIASGIEAGARNFLDSYLAVKKSKEENKYRKLAPVMQIIFSQIQDEKTPLDQKIKAMDSIESLLGVRSDVPLSVRLGLDKLAQQEMEVGEEKIAGKAAQSLEDQGAVEFNKKQTVSPTQLGSEEVGTNSVLATNVQTKATQSTTKKLLRRRGDLSQADIDLMQKKQLISAQRAEEFEYQYKLAQLNAGLQERALDKQGWKNNGDWTYNPDTKSWQQEWFNPITKETYQQKLQPGVVPESIILKQIQAGGAGGKGGVSLAYKTLRQSIATTMGKDVDDPEVEMQTAKIWKNNFALGVLNKQQNVEGTEPIQPGAKFDNNMKVLQAQQKHADLVAAASASLNNVNSLAKRKGDAWQAAADAKANFDKIKKDYDPDEKEYIAAENNWQDATKTANGLETEYQTALRSHNSNQEQVKLSKDFLDKSGITVGGTPQQSGFSPRMRVAIDAVRKANPNTKLTDAQIAERIRREKGIE